MTVLWAPEIIEEDTSRVSRRGTNTSVALFVPHPLPDDLANLLTADIPERELVPRRFGSWRLSSVDVDARVSFRLPKPVLPPAWEAPELVQARFAKAFESSICNVNTKWTYTSGSFPSREHILPFSISERLTSSIDAFWVTDDRVFAIAAKSESFVSSLLDGIEIVYSKRSQSFRDLAQKLLDALLIRIARILATARARLLMQLDVDERPITVIDMPEEPGAPQLNPSANERRSMAVLN